MRNLREKISKMSPYEQYKLTVDFMRFLATMLAPFMIVALQYIMRKLGAL